MQKSKGTSKSILLKIYCANAIQFLDYDENEIKSWYSRLGNKIQNDHSASIGTSLAALLLRKYLKLEDSTSEIEAPSHLKNSEPVREVLKYHRDVFLSTKKTKDGRWGGVIPRIRGEFGYKKWDIKSLLKMDYESLVEIDLIKAQNSGNNQELDLAYALHGFQLKSTVIVSAKIVQSSIMIKFQQWECSVQDEYNYDFDECITVPNPDFETKNTPFQAIFPKQMKLKVSHKNLKRLEDKGLAAPFKVRIKPWTETRFSNPEDINPNRKLF